jgi:hypothetical protein
LPRRRPGSSGITGVPPDKPERHHRRQPPRREDAVEPTPEPPAARPVSNTSSFFGPRRRATQPGDDAGRPGLRWGRPQPRSGEGESRAIEAQPGDDAGRPAPRRGRATERSETRDTRRPASPEPAAWESAVQPDAHEMEDGWPAEEVAALSGDAPETDLIYQRMLSEWLVDPHTLAHSADLDWKSVWDRGWSAAAEVDNVPVQDHTDHGLPVREPGARLVPGSATDESSSTSVNRVGGVAHHRAEETNGVASNGGFSSSRTGRKPAHEAPARDPDAIRASISSHFSGVRAGRSHARETDQGPDHE